MSIDFKGLASRLYFSQANSFPLNTVLGRRLQVFPLNPWRLGLNFGVLAIFGFIFPAVFIASRGAEPFISVSVGAMTSILLCLTLIWRMRSGTSPYAAALYENGFACLVGGRTMQIAWEQIQSVQVKVQESEVREGVVSLEDSETNVYIVTTKAGTVLALKDKIQNVDKLGEAIQEYWNPRATFLRFPSPKSP